MYQRGKIWVFQGHLLLGIVRNCTCSTPSKSSVDPETTGEMLSMTYGHVSCQPTVRDRVTKGAEGDKEGDKERTWACQLQEIATLFGCRAKSYFVCNRDGYMIVLEARQEAWLQSLLEEYFIQFPEWSPKPADKVIFIKFIKCIFNDLEAAELAWWSTTPDYDVWGMEERTHSPSGFWMSHIPEWLNGRGCDDSPGWGANSDMEGDSDAVSVDVVGLETGSVETFTHEEVPVSDAA
ncbi:hypothetical protein EDD18DRAFT_1110252 [Armillaria luteobubalina]|uniref:Uncharacterized protein n=1 Tax=Armillaria luteobubalina TaxID=153913 RepID=A0AA39PQC5_9AGAR|nr:hypothetical protein EDD18DRAFT_1110252 [Armillaria luteobubalina]